MPARAPALRRRRRCLHRRSFLHPPLRLPVPHDQAESRSVARGPGRACQQRLRRLRPLRRGRRGGGALPVLLSRRHRAERALVRPAGRTLARRGDRGTAPAWRRRARPGGVMTGGAPAARPLTILIGALGGEGGGVLTDWLVAAAMAADLPVQSTSIPGVAQRTGATTYYVEIFPTSNAALAGRRPFLGLYPCPGDMDVVIASELLEAGRAIENGYVTAERTTLIAATHRIYAVAEKQQMADGRFDASRILRGAREMARQPILFDLTHDAATRQLPLNAVLLGALAGSSVLPLARAGFEAAIRESGIAVDSNLAGFALGYRLATEGPGGTTVPRDDRVVAPLGKADLATLRQDAAREFPAEAIAFVEEGLRRLVDFQDADYAELYLTRLRRLREAGIDDGTLAEAARHLALWMAYQDIIRVAQMKSCATKCGPSRTSRYASPSFSSPASRRSARCCRRRSAGPSIAGRSGATCCIACICRCMSRRRMSTASCAFGCLPDCEAGAGAAIASPRSRR